MFGAQTANCPSTKSFSVAVVEVEERVSEATLEKHSPESPSVERLTPPS
jgi:hypothetical protein